MTAPQHSLRIPRVAIALVAVAFACVLWSYWTTLAEVAWRWTHDPQYSHGYLVPGFAAFLLWTRRARLDASAMRLNAWGLAILGGALVLRLAGTYFHFTYFDQMSLLPTLLGLVLLAGSWTAFTWAWPALAFLGFMIPLPHSWSVALSAPMQAFATAVSTFGLQVIGRPALAEGNIILLNDIELGIVEACSGLRMLVVFFALSTAVAMLTRKPLWERLVLAGSAIPIALIANVLRITTTGLVYDLVGNNFGGNLFHDVAGWLMMPLGLLLLGIEIWVLGRLLVEPERKSLTSPVTLQRVEAAPLSLYGRTPSPRRDRRAKAAAAVETAAPVTQS